MKKIKNIKILIYFVSLLFSWILYKEIIIRYFAYDLKFLSSFLLGNIAILLTMIKIDLK